MRGWVHIAVLLGLGVALLISWIFASQSTAGSLEDTLKALKIYFPYILALILAVVTGGSILVRLARKEPIDRKFIISRVLLLVGLGLFVAYGFPALWEEFGPKPAFKVKSLATLCNWPASPTYIKDFYIDEKSWSKDTSLSLMKPPVLGIFQDTVTLTYTVKCYTEDGQEVERNYVKTVSVGEFTCATVKQWFRKLPAGAHCVAILTIKTDEGTSDMKTVAFDVPSELEE